MHKDQKDKTATGTYVLHINSERKQGGELKYLSGFQSPKVECLLLKAWRLSQKTTNCESAFLHRCSVAYTRSSLAKHPTEWCTGDEFLHLNAPAHSALSSHESLHT